MTHTPPLRHLHRARLLGALRLPQGLLHSDSLDDRRVLGQPPPRAAAGAGAAGQHPGEVPGPADPAVRAARERRRRQRLHQQEL